MNHFQNYAYALSLTSQFYFCGLPLRLDTTPKCSLNCLYCFAMSRGGRRTSRTLIANPDLIQRKLTKSIETKQPGDILGQMLARKAPIHFGGLSDPFANASVARVSRALLKNFSTYDYPVVISTKNTRLLRDDATMKIIKKMRHVAVQVSFTSSHPRKTALIEPQVPSPQERLDCIEELSTEGIHIIARLQPLIPSWETEIAYNLIPQLANSGCKHVVVEYLKLPVEKNTSLMNKMFSALNWNGYDYYRENGARLVGREWILPKELILERIQPIVNAIRSNSMTYGSADYGLNNAGDTDCCCGIDRLPGFNNWFKGNIAAVIRNARTSKVTFQHLAHNWFPTGSIKRNINSNCRLDGLNDVLSHLKAKWNNPGSINAPDSLSGVSWNGERDAESNCIYSKGVSQ